MAREIRRMSLLGVVALWLVGTTASLASQPADVTVFVAPYAMQLLYSQPAVRPSDDDRVFFAGDPVIIGVWINNHREVALDLAPSREELGTRFLEKDVRPEPDDGSMPEIAWQPLAGDLAVLTRGDGAIPPNGQTRLYYTLHMTGGDSLPAGKYAVSVKLNVPAPLAPRSRAGLSHRVLFEVRAIASDLDRMDVFYRRGTLLRAHKRWDEAEAALSEVLRLNPNSGIALDELGMVHASHGDCERARAVWRRALQIVTTGADRQYPLRRSPGEVADWARGLTRRIEQCQ